MRIGTASRARLLPSPFAPEIRFSASPLDTKVESRGMAAEPPRVPAAAAAAFSIELSLDSIRRNNGERYVNRILREMVVA
jgi:hypothetical protein